MRMLFSRCCISAFLLVASAGAVAQDAGEFGQQPEEEPGSQPPPGTPGTPAQSSAGTVALPGVGSTDGARPSDATRGITVQRRARPEYDPFGSRLGSFRLDASADLRAGVDTNVYRVTDGPSDVFAIGRVDASLKSDWARHSVGIGGAFQHRQYAQETLRDLTTFRVEADGELDISAEARLNGEISHERSARDQLSAEEVEMVLRPVRFDQTTASLQGRYEGAQVVLSANGRYAHINYEPSVTLDGVERSLRDRDYDSYSVGGQAGYRFPAGAVAFVSASHEWRRYAIAATPRRDSELLEMLAGLESEITPLLFGRVAVGFLRTNFSDPSVKSRNSFAIDTQLEYLVSPLTTVRLTARRTLRDAALLAAPATLVTTVRLAADHELLRNVIVTPQVLYENADYLGSNQSAELFGAGVDTRWLINRRLRANVSAQYRTRSTENFSAGRDYGSFIGMVGITLAL